MKTKSKIIKSCILTAVSLGLLAVNTLNAANIQTGYVIGQVYPSFVDKAAVGDNDNTGNLGFAVQMTNLWQSGQTIRITGVSWPTRTAPVGTFTFYFYDLDQGANPNAFDGNGTETLVGTNTATLGTAIGAGTAAYCIFDQPIVFTAHSKGIAVTWLDSGGNQIIKVTPNTAYTNIVRVSTTTGVPIGGTSPYIRFSLFGSVVQPAPTGSLTWQGNVSSNWDGTANNWNLALGSNLFARTNYTDNGSYGPNVVFDDTIVSPTYYTNINLTTGTPLRPSSLVFNNSLFRYNFSGPSIITGGTILTNSGSGVVTLNTANNYTGGSVLTGGRIRLANAGGLGTGTVTFLSGGLSSVGSAPLTITNNLSLIGTAILGNTTDNGLLTCSAQINFNGGTYGIDAENNLILSGVLTNGGIGAKSGPGTLTLTGTDNESAGTWAVLNGTIIVNGIAANRTAGAIAVGASAGNSVATFIITNGGSVTINNANVVAVGAIGQSALTSSNYLYLSGTLGYGTNFTSGVLQLGQSSAYDEVDMLPGSVLAVGGITYNIGQALANTSVVNIDGGTIAALKNNTAFIPAATGSFTTAVNVLAGGVTFDSGSYAITIAQPLLEGGSGGGLTKTGNGTLWLSGANTYTGPTVVKAGTLGLYPGNTLSATSSLTVSNGAAVATDFTTPAGAAQTEVLSVSLNGSGVNVNYGDLSSAVSTSVAINNTVNSGVALNANGVNTITLTGTNFGIGTYPVIQFALRTGNGSFIASLPYGVVGSVATNGNQIVVNITAAPKSVTWFGSTDSSTINNHWNLTSPNWNSGNASYADDGVAGDYVTFDDSVFNDGSSYATNVNLTLALSPLTLTVNSSLNYVFTTTGSGKLTGLTPLTKNGAGSLAIMTANDYSGGSTLNSGAVFVGNNQALGSGAITLNGGSLASDGVTSRTLTNFVNISSATSALGDSVNSGTLTLSGPVSFKVAGQQLTANSAVVFSGTLSMQVSAFSLTANQVTGAGNITCAGNLVVSNLSATAMAAGQVYQLFTNNGTISGNFASITLQGTGSSGLTGTFNPANGQLTLAAAATKPPVINQVTTSGVNLILQGTNGTAGTSYSILTATNITMPMTNWTTNATGVFGAGGTFSNGIPLGGEPARYFRIKTP